MATAFRFAHLSDPHLLLAPALPRPLAALAGKRLPGYLSWRRHRRHIHRSEILALLVADIRAHDPDHSVLTGDLVNLALPDEYVRAAAWLAELGDPRDVTLVPGNHDALVPLPWDQGLGHWRAYMTGDGIAGDAGPDHRFPFVRVRGPIAFVGLSSAVPTPAFTAGGRLGAKQLAQAGELLDELGHRPLFRVLLLHHPPIHRHQRWARKALADRHGLQHLLGRVGAELVLHGHTHRSLLAKLPGPAGDIPVIAVPSASAAPSPRGDAARWHLCTVEPDGAGWRLRITVRGLNAAGDGFETQGRFSLTLAGGDPAAQGTDGRHAAS